MKTRKSFGLLLAVVLVTLSPSVKAQDGVEASIGADVVSQYIWRGQNLGNAAIQPTVGLSYKGLSLSAWGSTGITEASDTKEFDLTLSYATEGFHVGVTDYWFDKATNYKSGYIEDANISSMVLMARPTLTRPMSAMTSEYSLLTGTPTSPETMVLTRTVTAPTQAILRLVLLSNSLLATGKPQSVLCLTERTSIVRLTVLQ